jgi:arginase family enzyme
MKHPDSVNAPEYAWLKDYPALDPRRLAYVGLRDLDKGEKKIIRDFGIKAFTMKEVDKLGIGAVMEQAIDHLRGREDRPIHLSFDIGTHASKSTPMRGYSVPARFCAAAMSTHAHLTSFLFRLRSLSPSFRRR